MGKYGIRFSKKSRKGKRAIKKLNAIDPALEEKVPSIIPIKYVFIRSYIDNPLSPGNFILLGTVIKKRSPGVFKINFSRSLLISLLGLNPNCKQNVLLLH
jgi:hypothetical protein